MSLYGSLQTASNTLQATQIGLEVASNNVANANTEGYIREKVNYSPAPTQERGAVAIGLGVQIDGVTQQIDTYLGEQLRTASADVESAAVQNDAYKTLEQSLGELTDQDLSTALTNFTASLQDTLSPAAGEDLSVRNLAVREGETLSREIRRLDDRTKDQRDAYDEQIVQSVTSINRLTEEIARLNVQVVQTEAGTGNSDAGALRSQRNSLVNDLSDLINVTVIEQPSGGLSISTGGELLVFEGQRRGVAVETSDPSGTPKSTIEFADTKKNLELNGGRVDGLVKSRQIVDDFRADLDGFTGNLIYEFNRQYSQGQGEIGFASLRAQDPVIDPEAPLDAAGLPFAPENGSFDLTVTNPNTGSTETTRIDVRLLGGQDDTSLDDLAAQIDAVDGVSATVDATGRLAIDGDSADTRFFFSDDSSGALASLGLNTFFTGSTAADIGVNEELDGIENAGRFAASNAGLGGGTGNAVELAAFLDQPLDTLGGATLTDQYDQVVNELAQNSTVAGSVVEGLTVYEQTLNAKFESISGVNIDEETVNMIALQDVYQATARYISVIQEMLDVLIAL